MNRSSGPQSPVLPSDIKSSPKECASPKESPSPKKSLTYALSSLTKSMLTPYTVVIGRGKQCQEFVGNKRLQVLAKTVVHQYAEADGREEKSHVVSFLIRSIKDGGGTFVRMVDDDHFEQANGRITREKVCVVLRNLLQDKYRSSTKSKVATRRKQTRLAKSGSSPNGSGSSPSSRSSSSSSSSSSTVHGISTSKPRSSDGDEPLPDELLLSNGKHLEILVEDGSEHDHASDAPSSRLQGGSTLESHSLEPERRSLDQELLSCENILDLPGDGEDKGDDARSCCSFSKTF